MAPRQGRSNSTIPHRLPSPDGDGTGNPALAESQSGVTVYAQVTCLFVAGHAAVVGGDVVKAEPARYVGKQIVVLLTDSEQSPGTMSWGFYEPGRECPATASPFRPMHRSRSRAVARK